MVLIIAFNTHKKHLITFAKINHFKGEFTCKENFSSFPAKSSIYVSEPLGGAGGTGRGQTQGKIQDENVRVEFVS